MQTKLCSRMFITIYNEMGAAWEQQRNGHIKGARQKGLHGPVSRLEAGVRRLREGLVTSSRVKHNQDIKLHI